MLKKRLISAISAAMIMASAMPIISYADYSDVPSDAWYSEYLSELSEKDAIKGYEDGTFKPDNNVTVAEFVKTIVSLTMGELQSDVAEGEHWAKKYIDAAIEAGLAEEISEYDEPITRGLMAVLLDNTSVNVLKEEKIADTAAAQELADWEGIDAADAVAQCYCKGIIGGYDDGEFKPDNRMTRAEMCAVLVRLTDESLRLKNVEETPEPTAEPEPTEAPAAVSVKYLAKKDDAELKDADALVLEEDGKMEISPANLKADNYRVEGYSIDGGEMQTIFGDELPLKLDVSDGSSHEVVFYYGLFPESNANARFSQRTLTIFDKVSHFKKAANGEIRECYHDVEIYLKKEVNDLERRFKVRAKDESETVLSGQTFVINDGIIKLIVGHEIKKGSVADCPAIDFNTEINMPIYEIHPPTLTAALPYILEGSGEYEGITQPGNIEFRCKDDSPFLYDATESEKEYEYSMYIPEDQRITDGNKLVAPITKEELAEFGERVPDIQHSAAESVWQQIIVNFGGTAFGNAQWDDQYFINFWTRKLVDD